MARGRSTSRGVALGGVARGRRNLAEAVREANRLRRTGNKKPKKTKKKRDPELDAYFEAPYNSRGQTRALGLATLKRNRQMMDEQGAIPRTGRKLNMAKGGSFPDLNKDGKVTKADVLKGRGVPGFKKGGKIDGCAIRGKTRCPRSKK